MVLRLDRFRERRRREVQRGELDRLDLTISISRTRPPVTSTRAHTLHANEGRPDDALGDLAQPPRIGLSCPAAPSR